MNAPNDKSTHTSNASVSIMPGPPAPAQPTPATFFEGGVSDVTTMIRRAFAHWYIVLVTLILGGLVTSQVVRTRKPSYRSETVIFYREGIGRSIAGSSESQEMVRNLGTKLKETLLAQQTLRKLIDEFHLYSDVVQKSGYADAVDQMRKKSDFKSRAQDTFAISFEGTSQEEAQKVCARMAELLVQENAKRAKLDTRGTTEFLELEKKRADDELERIERELSAFMSAHPEFLGQSNVGLGTESLAREKKAEEAKKLASGFKLGATTRVRRSDGTILAVPASPGMVAVDPVLLAARTTAITELLNAKKDLADKVSRFTEQHPDVRAAQDRVAAAESSLRHAEGVLAAAAPKDDAPAKPLPKVDNPYESEGQGEAVGAAPVAAPPLATAKPDAPEVDTKSVELEVEWVRLQRMLNIARSRQADLDQKLFKAEMVASTAESGYGSALSVLDPAFKPSAPSNVPNKTVLMVGLAASVAVGLLFSAAWGLFIDDRLFAASEIEPLVMVPVLGAVPKQRKRAVKNDKDPPKNGGAFQRLGGVLRG